jgi:hypothetical protein
MDFVPYSFMLRLGRLARRLECYVLCNRFQSCIFVMMLRGYVDCFDRRMRHSRCSADANVTICCDRNEVIVFGKSQNVVLLKSLTVLRHVVWCRPPLHPRLFGGARLHVVLLRRGTGLIQIPVHATIRLAAHGIHLSITHVRLARHLWRRHLITRML